MPNNAFLQTWSLHLTFKDVLLVNLTPEILSFTFTLIEKACMWRDCNWGRDRPVKAQRFRKCTAVGTRESTSELNFFSELLEKYL